MATDSCDSTASPPQALPSDVTQEDVKAQEALLRKLRQEGASKENASLSWLLSFLVLTNQNACKGTPHVIWCNDYCYAKEWAFKQSYCNPLSHRVLRVCWFHHPVPSHCRLMRPLPNWRNWKATWVPMHPITLSLSAQRYLYPLFYFFFVLYCLVCVVCAFLENISPEPAHSHQFGVKSSAPL